MSPSHITKKLQDILKFTNQTKKTESQNYENVGNATIISGNLQYLVNPGPYFDKTVDPIMVLLT